MRPAIPAPIAIPAISALALGAAACVQAEAEPNYIAGVDTQRQCFFTREIDSYRMVEEGPGGEERFVVRTGPDADWLFETERPCIDLAVSRGIALDTQSLSSVCTGTVEFLLVPSTVSDVPDRCPVRLLGKVIED